MSTLFPCHANQAWRSELSEKLSKGSSTSLNTVRHISDRKVSPSSAGSLASTASGPLRVINTNVLVGRSTSQALSSIPLTPETCSQSRPAKLQVSHKSSWGNEIPLPPHPGPDPSLVADGASFEDVNLESDCSPEQRDTRYDGEQFVGEDIDRCLSFDRNEDEVLSLHSSGHDERSDGRSSEPRITDSDTVSHPLRKWLGSLRPNWSGQNAKHLAIRRERWSLDDFDDAKMDRSLPSDVLDLRGHRKASSWAATNLVSVVKSAAARLEFGVGPQSRKSSTNAFRGRSKRASRLSNITNPLSAASTQDTDQVFDEPARKRAVQRQKILEELVSSEANYISDLKVLYNLYCMIVDSVPSIPHSIRSDMSRPIEDILQLHEEIFGQMKAYVPNIVIRADHNSKPMKHQKHRSSGLQSEAASRVASSTRHSPPWFEHLKPRDLISELKQGAGIAKLFEKMLVRFFIYEEYGARYESMLNYMASTSKTIPNWSAIERGIETLVNSLARQENSGKRNKKSLTFEDLLIKPIQRVCKYPLFFMDLLNNLPVSDDPEAKEAIEKVIYRLRETNRVINKATNDPLSQAKIKRSWLLQDLIFLPIDEGHGSWFLNSAARSFSSRDLGHVHLCGVLYVAYQTRKDLRGEYMLCALFNSYLVLAVPRHNSQKYEIVAIANMSDVQTDSSGNGRGLQCHTAPFSWKILFEHDQRLYEFVLCACSAREEQQWKSSLAAFSVDESERQNGDSSVAASGFCGFSLDIKPLGEVFGQRGTLTRRLSIQRAATINLRTSICQVIIRNTSALKGSNEQITDITMSRSQSLLETRRIPILAPKRVDRIRMEHALAHVWTGDSLPFPGMSGRRFIRTSASSMMRKLSKTSTASKSTTRTVSCASIPETTVRDTQISRLHCDKPHGQDVAQSKSHGFDATQVTIRSYDGADSLEEEALTEVKKERASSTNSKSSQNEMSCNGSGNSSTFATQGTDTLEGRSHMKSNLGKLRKLLKPFSVEGIKGRFIGRNATNVAVEL